MKNIIKRDLIVANKVCYSEECEHINQELFICAEQQGYAIIFDGRICFELLVVLDLSKIQQAEDKK